MLKPILDPDGAHLAALQRLADFRGRRVLELGCGEGRLTVPIARDAVHVLAFDTNAEAVESARRSLPPELTERVAYRVASGKAIQVERHSFDVTLFSWALWCVEPEDVVHVLSNMVDAVEPGGFALDLQVIRPNPVIETRGRILCEVDGAPLFRKADAATAAIDALVRDGRLVEQANDVHDVRKEYATGAALVRDFAGSEREIPPAAVGELLELDEGCAVRERCRLRRLAVIY